MFMHVLSCIYNSMIHHVLQVFFTSFIMHFFGVHIFRVVSICTVQLRYYSGACSADPVFDA